MIATRCVLAVAALFALSPAHSVQPPKPRLPVNEAVRIAHELFPDFCGARPPGCTILVNAPTNCPFEILITFPDELRTPDTPRFVWVALDEHRRVIAISSRKQEACSRS